MIDSSISVLIVLLIIIISAFLFYAIIQIKQKVSTLELDNEYLYQSMTNSEEKQKDDKKRHMYSYYDNENNQNAYIDAKFNDNNYANSLNFLELEKKILNQSNHSHPDLLS
jgi:uncharacterized protein YxeA